MSPCNVLDVELVTPIQPYYLGENITLHCRGLNIPNPRYIELTIMNSADRRELLVYYCYWDPVDGRWYSGSTFELPLNDYFNVTNCKQLPDTAVGTILSLSLTFIGIVKLAMADSIMECGVQYYSRKIKRESSLMVSIPSVYGTYRE